MVFYLSSFSVYSIKRGTATPSRMCEKLAAAGYKYAFLADLNTTAGFVDFIQSARKNNLIPLLGVKLRVLYKKYLGSLTVVFSSLVDYEAFCVLFNSKKMSASSEGSFLYEDVKAAFSKTGACILSEGVESLVFRIFCENKELFSPVIEMLTSDFGGRLFVGYSSFSEDTTWKSHVLSSKEVLLPVVANRLSYLDESHFLIYEYMLKLGRYNTDLCKNTLLPIKQVKASMGADDMSPLENMKTLAKFCKKFADQFMKSVDNLVVYKNPGEEKRLEKEVVEKLCSFKGVENFSEYELRLAEELVGFKDMGLLSSIGVLKNIISAANSLSIFVGPGRGSSVGSLLLFLLGVTKVDPVAHGLSFSRFIDRKEKLPDVDIDVCAEGRGALVKALMEKNNGDGFCHMVHAPHFLYHSASETFNDFIIHFSYKGGVDPAFLSPKVSSSEAIRRVFSHMAGSMSVIKSDFEGGRSVSDKLCSLCEELSNVVNMPNDVASIATEIGFYKKSDVALEKKMIFLIEALQSRLAFVINCLDIFESCIKTASYHPVGFFFSSENFLKKAPLTFSEKTGFPILSLKTLGSVKSFKTDILGLKCLSVVDRICKDVAVEPDYEKAIKDPGVYRLCVSGQFGGIFQMRHSTRDVARKVYVNNFNKLSACIALSKPGAQIEPYMSQPAVEIANPSLQTAYSSMFKSTNNVPVYQEQVIDFMSHIFDGDWSQYKIKEAVISNSPEAFLAEKGEYIRRIVSLYPEDKEFLLSLFDSCHKACPGLISKSHAVSYAYIIALMLYLKSEHLSAFVATTLSKDPSADDILDIAIEQIAEDTGFFLSAPHIYGAVNDCSVTSHGGALTVYQLPLKQVSRVCRSHWEIFDKAKGAMESRLAAAFPVSIVKQMFTEGVFRYTGYDLNELTNKVLVEKKLRTEQSLLSSFFVKEVQEEDKTIYLEKAFNYDVVKEAKTEARIRGFSCLKISSTSLLLRLANCLSKLYVVKKCSANYIISVGVEEKTSVFAGIDGHGNSHLKSVLVGDVLHKDKWISLTSLLFTHNRLPADYVSEKMWVTVTTTVVLKLFFGSDPVLVEVEGAFYKACAETRSLDPTMFLFGIECGFVKGFGPSS